MAANSKAAPVNEKSPIPAMPGSHGAWLPSKSLPLPETNPGAAGNQVVQRLLRKGTIQTRLEVGRSDDPLEREAEAAAELCDRGVPCGHSATSCVGCKHQLIQCKPSDASETGVRPILPTVVPVQAKFSVTQPGEPLEQEADQAAETAVSAQTAGRCEGITCPYGGCSACHHSFSVHRKVIPGSPAIAAPAPVKAALHSGGRPLDPPVRSAMEAAFGADFSNVRVHTDPQAAESARSIQALAYTAGSNVVFSAGRYAPETTDGRQLLAHELAHVVQQEDSGFENAAVKIQRVVNGDITHMSITPEWARNLTDEELEEQVWIVRGQFYGPLSRGEVMEENIRGNLDILESEVIRRNLMSADKKNRIQEILSYGWVGPFNEYELQDIWNSFGNQLPEILMVAEYWELWQSCISRGAELWDIPAVQPFKEVFRNDVKAIARQYLLANRELARNELERLGVLHPGEAGSPEAAQQDEAVQNLQDVALLVARAQRAQQELLQTQVGWEIEPDAMPGLLSGLAHVSLEDHARSLLSRDRPERYIHAENFNPYSTPRIGALGHEQPPLPAYQEVMDRYLPVTALIASLSNHFPAIYALVRNNRTAEFAQGSPQQARMVINQALENLLQKIDESATALQIDDLDYRDLRPIHDQLFAGHPAPSGTEWNQPFYQGVATAVVADHESQNFWEAMGLATLAAAAFIVSNIVSFGTATFFIAAGIGLAASTTIAGISWERYEDFSTAEQTTLSDELALVSHEQVTGAMLSAVLDTAFVFLDAFGPVARGVRTLGARPILRELGEMAERPLAEAAEQGTRQGMSRGIEGAETVMLTQEQFLGALSHTFPSHYLEQIPRTIDEIGATAANSVVTNPSFLQACRNRNWALAGTLFHSAARREGAALAEAGRLPAGWRFEFELTIQAGKGGSRLDIFIRGPAGEVMEYDWKTTGRSAISSGARHEMARHGSQVTSNLGLTLARQQSISWVDLARSAWQDLIRRDPELAAQVLGANPATTPILWP